MLIKSFSKVVKAREKSSKNVFVDNFNDKKNEKVVNFYDFIENLKNESSFSIKKKQINVQKIIKFRKIK